MLLACGHVDQAGTYDRHGMQFSQLVLLTLNRYLLAGMMNPIDTEGSNKFLRYLEDSKHLKGIFRAFKPPVPVGNET